MKRFLLTVVCSGMFASTAMAAVTGPVVVVAHIDLLPQAVPQGVQTLRDFAQESRRDPGVASFVLITWAPTTNHFQLLEVYNSMAAFQNHVQAPHTVAFRSSIEADIGAPFDERIYTPLRN